ncbi:hypothetical protein ACFZBP_36655 [Streptomyces sp. NPDC008086]|uniref:hypothetical protein n=1 Tax=Streptomyces sp. NPDC008086 TaxID=3364807 RepID=UPI0036E74FFE
MENGTCVPKSFCTPSGMQILVNTHLTKRNSMNLRTSRLATSGLLTLSLVAGVTVATSATANAAVSSVGKKACTESVKLNTRVSATVKFRTGPGVKWLAKGQLAEDTRVYWGCNRGSTGSNKSWSYVKVKNGVHAGKVGWVSQRYVPVPMQLD